MPDTPTVAPAMPTEAPPRNPSNYDPTMDAPSVPKRGGRRLIPDLFYCILHHGPRTGCPPFESFEHYRGNQVQCPTCGGLNVKPVEEENEDAARAEMKVAKETAAPPTEPSATPAEGGGA